MIRLRRAFVILLCSFGIGQEIDRELGLPVLLSVPTPPTPVRAAGKQRLVYELHVVNASSKTITLRRLDVGGSTRLATLEGDELVKCMRQSRIDARDLRVIEAGGHAVVLLWLAVDESPSTLEHRLEGIVDGDAEPLWVRHSGTPVTGKPVRLQPPLRGEGWVAVNGPSNSTHHRRSWLSFEGRALVPQRFAIDFVRVTAEGALFKGDPKNNSSHLCYGAEVLAVADSVVAAAKDGIAESHPGEKFHGLRKSLDEVEGNYVSLELEGGRYAIYAHLQPGSLRVKTGDRVRAGQVLGLVGNSGNSTGPHLHFQVSTGRTVLVGDGVPFVFDSFYKGRELRRDEMPLQDWQVNFVR